jgi:hypothetical protein
MWHKNKIDVETYEWTVIPALLQHGIAKELPRQSALELHLLATTESPQQPKCTLRLKPSNQANSAVNKAIKPLYALSLF